MSFSIFVCCHATRAYQFLAARPPLPRTNLFLLHLCSSLIFYRIIRFPSLTMAHLGLTDYFDYMPLGSLREREVCDSARLTGVITSLQPRRASLSQMSRVRGTSSSGSFTPPGLPSTNSAHVLPGILTSAYGFSYSSARCNFQLRRVLWRRLRFHTIRASRASLRPPCFTHYTVRHPRHDNGHWRQPLPCQCIDFRFIFAGIGIHYFMADYYIYAFIIFR